MSLSIFKNKLKTETETTTNQERVICRTAMEQWLISDIDPLDYKSEYCQFISALYFIISTNFL